MHFNFEIRPSWAGFQSASAWFMDVCVAVLSLASVCPVGFGRQWMLPKAN